MPEHADGSNESKETKDAAEVDWDGCQTGTNAHAHIDEARQRYLPEHSQTKYCQQSVEMDSNWPPLYCVYASEARDHGWQCRKPWKRVDQSNRDANICEVAKPGKSANLQILKQSLLGNSNHSINSLRERTEHNMSSPRR